MKVIGALFREVLGLFVDDGALALEIVAVVALVTLFAALVPSLPLLTGSILALGCLGVLLANVLLR